MGTDFVQRMLEASVVRRDCGCGGTCSGRANTAPKTEEFLDDSELQQELALSAFVQAKLTVSRPDDPYEQEADRVADQALRKVAAVGLPSGGLDGEPTVQRAEDLTTGDENAAGVPLILLFSVQQDGVQARSEAEGFDVSDDFEAELAATKGGGGSIPTPAREEMESAFGADFSSVRLHTDNHAVSMSRKINAYAFTHSNDIYFNEGMFNPSTDVGKHLLAHELTHTIQQGEGKVRLADTYTQFERQRRLWGEKRSLDICSGQSRPGRRLHCSVDTGPRDH